MDSLDAWRRICIRAGKILAVRPFVKARRPSYQLDIDFGSEAGTRVSSAQLVLNYPEKDELVGRQILAVVNLPPRRIAGFSSQVLVLGLCDPEHASRTVLVQAHGGPVPLGTRVVALGAAVGTEEDTADYSVFEGIKTALGRIAAKGDQMVADIGSQTVPLAQGHPDLAEDMLVLVLLEKNLGYPLCVGDRLVVPDQPVVPGLPLR